ncbi:protein-serine,threonine phosphatase [Sarracenia purpurea var. burkii]
MPCAVAVANSPVFLSSSSSPRVFSSMFTKPSVSLPANLNLQGSILSPSAPPHSSSPSSPSSCPLSPLGLRLQRQLKDEFFSCSSSSSSSSSLYTSPTLLKRKRPARIDIPIDSMRFSAVETPEALDRLNVMEFEGDGYSVYCKRGKRGAMEDRYSAVVNHQGDSKQALFGVFDGHGGAKAAEFAANNLGRNIINEVRRRAGEEIEAAVKDGYLNTDAEFLKEDANGGTCCVTALVHQGELIVSNAGDCRAVMSRGGVAEALTADHRPSRKDERDRIENKGGYVDCCRGVWRIQGSLAVSRAIGDRHLREWVVAEPDTTRLRMQPECEFLILASDGLWDKVNTQEAVDVVRPLCIGVDNPEPFSACKKLADLSVTRGSTDDISIMLIQLAHFLPQ